MPCVFLTVQAKVPGSAFSKGLWSSASPVCHQRVTPPAQATHIPSLTAFLKSFIFTSVQPETPNLPLGDPLQLACLSHRATPRSGKSIRGEVRFFPAPSILTCGFVTWHPKSLVPFTGPHCALQRPSNCRSPSVCTRSCAPSSAGNQHFILLNLLSSLCILFPTFTHILIAHCFFVLSSILPWVDSCSFNYLSFKGRLSRFPVWIIISTNCFYKHLGTHSCWII